MFIKQRAKKEMANLVSQGMQGSSGRAHRLRKNQTVFSRAKSMEPNDTDEREREMYAMRPRSVRAGKACDRWAASERLVRVHGKCSKSQFTWPILRKLSKNPGLNQEREREKRARVSSYNGGKWMPSMPQC